MDWTALNLTSVPHFGNHPPETRVDPYLAWACLTDFRGYFPAGQPGSPAREIAILAVVGDPADVARLKHLRLTDLYEARPAQGEVQSRFFTASFKLGKLPEVWAENPTLNFELGIALQPQVLSLLEAVPPPAISSTSHMLAVIDDGCPVFNRQFFSPDRRDTRFYRLWDQGGEASGPHWASPPRAYGRELSRDAVRALLPHVEADNYETLAYALGNNGIGDGPRFGSHGSHVLDLTAGSKHPLTEERDLASKADLMFVNLPIVTVLDSSGGALGVQVLDAVRYIMAHSAPDKALVINLSYGTQAGPHDGSSLIEQALDEALSMRDNFALVVSAGNSRQSNAHAAFTLQPGVPIELRLRLPEEDITDGFVEIWYDAPAHEAHGPTISITAPGGQRPSPGCQPNHHCQCVDGSGRVVAALFHFRKTPCGSRSMALLALAGGLPDIDGASRAQPGIWKIEISAPAAGTALSMGAWVERDDLPHGTSAKPLSFVADTPTASQPGTMIGLACGNSTLVVGACRWSDGEPLGYSSIGQRIGAPPPPRIGPHVLAPAEENMALGGLRAGGMLTGDTFRMGGSSVAAPLLAREFFNVMAQTIDAGARITLADHPKTLDAALKAANAKGLCMRRLTLDDSNDIDPDS